VYNKANSIFSDKTGNHLKKSSDNTTLCTSLHYPHTLSDYIELSSN